MSASEQSVSAGRSRRLVIALALNVVLVAGQVVFGFAAHSLGLLADGAHNVTDVFAVGVSLVAVQLSRRPPTATHSYGWHRATILAALGNAVLILAVTAVIVVEAVVRLGHPEPVRGGVMLVVALGATALNVGAALVLRERRVDLNMRSSFLHMAADAGASLGVAAAGAVILATGRFDWLDPAVSIMIGVVVAAEAWRLVRAAVDVLLESTPSDIDLDDLHAAMAGIDHADGVHDLHVWSLSSGIRVLSAHVVLTGSPSLADAEAVGDRMKVMLADRYGIAHATLEVETAGHAVCVADAERHVPG
jgi:cobalt-zinc-cadmium efflux system protein